MLAFRAEIDELKLTIEAMLSMEWSLQSWIKCLEELLMKAEIDSRESDAKHVVCGLAKNYKIHCNGNQNFE